MEQWQPVSGIQIEKLTRLLEGRGLFNAVAGIIFHTNFRDRGQALELQLVVLKTLDGREICLRGFIYLNEDVLEILMDRG